MANTTTKVTKKDYFNMIISMAEEANRQDIVDFCSHELELLGRKSNGTGTKSETKAQKINKVLDERILAVVTEASTPLTASAIMGLVDISGIEGLTELTLPKVTNRLTALGKVGKSIDRIKDKRQVFFTAGTGEGFNTTAAD